MPEGVPDYAQAASTLPTLARLRDLVYAPLRDGERAFVEPWFVDHLVNEGYRDIVARLRLRVLEVEATTSASSTITVPTDFVEIVDLWVGTVPVAFQTDAVFQSYAVQGNSTPLDGAVIIARMSDISTIEMYPAQESEDYTLRYSARPVEMVADDDTPDSITYELVPRVVNYARAYAKWQEGEETEGQRYMAMYEQGLPGAPREAARMRPSMMSIIPEQGPFG